MKAGFVGIGVVVLLLIVLLFVGGSYIGAKNHLVALNSEVDTTYSDVNIAQQRRMDLIPNLVASVKGYVAEESTVLTNIANARAGVIAAGCDRAFRIPATKT